MHPGSHGDESGAASAAAVRPGEPLGESTAHGTDVRQIELPDALARRGGEQSIPEPRESPGVDPRRVQFALVVGGREQDVEVTRALEIDERHAGGEMLS